MSEHPARTMARELFSDVPRAKGTFFGALVLHLMASVCAVGLMASSGLLISWAAAMPPIMHLNVVIVIVRACGLFRGVFRYAERMLSHHLGLRLQSVLRVRTYSKLARTTLLGRRRGDLLVRVVADVEAIQDLIVRVALPFASAFVLTVATAIGITALSPLAGLALFGSAFAAGWVVPMLARWASKTADRAAVPLRGELADRVTEVNQAAYDLAAYGDQSRVDQLLAVDDRLRRAEERAALIRGLAVAAQVLAAGFAVVVALLVGAPAVLDGSLDRILLAVLVLTPLALHDVLTDLIQSAQTLTRAQTALARVTTLLDAPPVGAGDRGDAEPSATPGITVRDATLAWPGQTPVVSGLNLDVRPGERVALTGPSGIGKTTVAAALMGLLPAAEGTIEVDGTVGYLAQDAHIFNTSVAENVKIGNKDASPEEVRRALDLAGLASLQPERIVGEDGGMLSGGEAQRVALARLLVGEHQNWILDEPTEHLDEATATALLADVWQRAGQDPVLVITHDPRVMASCDRIVRLTSAEGR